MRDSAGPADDDECVLTLFPIAVHYTSQFDRTHSQINQIRAVDAIALAARSSFARRARARPRSIAARWLEQKNPMGKTLK